MTTLKNAQSLSPRTFEAIQKTLSEHKVQRISFDYDQGRIVALEFSLEIEGTLYPFRLPARIENVERIMYGKFPNQKQKEQAYRTAWANIRDWVTAQLAMIDTGMVKAEEVFLPYLISSRGTTFFEEMQQNQFLLPREKEGR